MKHKKCLDCGKPIKNESTRCRSCSKKVPFEARFWSKVDKNGPTMPHMDTPCWEWIGRKLKSKFAYGYFDVLVETNHSISVYAHRISWQLANNQTIPPGLYILHRCDNPSCVNPDHLFLGTYKDNSDDMTRKGRAVHVKGENHPSAKLTWIQVNEIRSKFGVLSRKQLAKEYNVSWDTIQRIVTGRLWKQGD